MHRHLKQYRLYIVVLICVSAFAAGCSMGRIQTKNYFIISYTPSPSIPPGSRRPYDYSLQVARFDVQRIFNRQNILYRFSPHQIQYYELEQWAIRPEDMITDVVFKHIVGSGLVNRVGTEYYETRPDFRIEGTVEALEKLDAGDLFYAHLAMTLRMFHGETGTQVWEYAFDQRRQVYQQEMVYTVRGLSDILQSQMNVVVSQLDSLFLAMETGDGRIFQKEPAAAKDAAPVRKEDVPQDDIDESTFEIIPENQDRREVK